MPFCHYMIMANGMNGTSHKIQGTSCQNCCHQNSFMVVMLKLSALTNKKLSLRVVKKSTITVTTLTTQNWSKLTTF